ncbi:MAG: peptide-methionine (R)-S-oxide reductase MsrB [Rhodospirillaceae bacterium]
MNRRSWLQALGAAVAAGVSGRTVAAPPSSVSVNPSDLQRNWRALVPATAKLPTPGDKLNLTDAEWKKRLSAAQYHVLRHEGTERAGSSPLNEEKRPGVFVCAGCDLPLFTSEMKYESGTGWPSFFTTIPGAFDTKKDYLLVWPRIEYHCTRCGGHHGHVFDDGPQPTRQRWCNNGVALKFLPRDA